MNLRNRVKQLLKMCGHAFVGTVHDRLNDVDRQLSDLKAVADSLAEQQGDLKAAADSLAEADGALLQSGIRTIEGLKDVQEEVRRQDAEARQRLDEMGARWRELRGAVQSLSEQNGHLSDATAQLQNNFSQFQNHLRWVLDNEVPRQVCVETGEYGFTNPETGLFSFLYSYLPERGALDIGANHGSVSELLLKAGYEVYALD